MGANVHVFCINVSNNLGPQRLGELPNKIFYRTALPIDEEYIDG